MFYKFSIAIVLPIGLLDFFFVNFLRVYILICEIDCILLGKTSEEVVIQQFNNQNKLIDG
jgi:hypothetical protein